MLLAIDTATRQASIALFDGQTIIGEQTWVARENHTTTLMPEIDHLLTITAQSIDNLRALAVSIGPGSFTSLRVGISLAKGLALTRQLPLLGIPTLDSVAFAERDARETICALLFAGRGRYAAALYQAHARGVERISAYFVGTPNEWLAWAHQANSPLHITGEMDDSLRALIVSQLPDARVASPAQASRRAGYLAEMAWMRFARGEADNLATLAPLYLPTASVPATIV